MVNEQRNILHEIRKRKANWIVHILHRNCLLKQVIEGKIKGEMEVTRRRGRRRKKLVYGLKDRRGYSHLKDEALDRTMWRNRFRGGFGPVVRQNTEWMNHATNATYSSHLHIAFVVRKAGKAGEPSIKQRPLRNRGALDRNFLSFLVSLPNLVWSHRLSH